MATSERPTAKSTRPTPFLLSSLLPHLLSPFPTALPPTYLSRSTQEAAHFLSLDPDNDAYWTLGRNDQQVALKRRELVEAGNLDDVVLSDPYYDAHDPDELRSLVTLSLPYGSSATSSSSLGVVFVWEETASPLAAMHAGPTGRGDESHRDDVRPGWTFLELLALEQRPEEVIVTSGGSNRRVWYASVEEAERDAGRSQGNGSTPPSGIAASLNNGSNGRPAALDLSHLQSHPPQGDYAFDTRGEHDLDGDDEEAYRDPAFGGRPATTTNKKAPVADMADGEGTTPGAYGSPNDFWANWSDDEGATGGFASGSRSAVRTPAREAEDADDAYWASYGGVDSVVGEDDGHTADGAEDEAASPRPSQRVDTIASSNGDAPPVPKTRTRRSSTVTPFNGRPDEAMPARPPFVQQTSAFPTYPLDVAALSDRLTRAQSRSADSDDETDVDLRLALEGIWRMYVGRAKLDEEELEDKKKRFGKVVAGVMSAEVLSR
ncbi:hypothetical protein BMF94_4598 [Rhodotorula taiwanensis]|uniref:Uncharacterized protein n=1 Tax=Rhodotorula taiwanensis TaxID=741276 RepID=A0A2S5B6C0_9BASI|nr:hypothetical protein BMF94_4598 [Rhodotorula taiwanensis]